MSADHEGVIAAALDYVFGVAANDRDRIGRAYAVDKAQMKLVDSGPDGERVFTIPIAEVWDKIWSRLPESPDHTAEVLTLTVTEGRMASVTINNNNAFLDQLSLYKVNGDWKIVDKLALRHPAATPLELDLDGLFGPQ